MRAPSDGRHSMLGITPSTGRVLLGDGEGPVRRHPATHHLHEQQRHGGQKGERGLVLWCGTGWDEDTILPKWSASVGALLDSPPEVGTAWLVLFWTGGGHM